MSSIAHGMFLDSSPGSPLTRPVLLALQVRLVRVLNLNSTHQLTSHHRPLSHRHRLIITIASSSPSSHHHHHLIIIILLHHCPHLNLTLDGFIPPPLPSPRPRVTITGDKGSFTRLVHCKYITRKWTKYLGYTHPVHPRYIQNFPCQCSCNFPGLGNSQDIHSVPGHMTAVFPLCN